MNPILESIRNFFSLPAKIEETIEDLEAKIKAEDTEMKRLQAILEAKQKLFDTRQKTKEIEDKIAGVGKPVQKAGMRKPNRI